VRCDDVHCVLVLLLSGSPSPFARSLFLMSSGSAPPLCVCDLSSAPLSPLYSLLSLSRALSLSLSPYFSVSLPVAPPMQLSACPEPGVVLLGLLFNFAAAGPSLSVGEKIAEARHIKIARGRRRRRGEEREMKNKGWSIRWRPGYCAWAR